MQSASSSGPVPHGHKYYLPSGSIGFDVVSWSVNKPDETLRNGPNEHSQHDDGPTLGVHDNAMKDLTNISEETIKPEPSLVRPKVENDYPITVKLEISEIDISQIDADDSKPRRKGRVFMEAVLIPPSSWSNRDRQTKKEDPDREKDHMNPKWKIKVKKDQFSLGLDTVFRRIDEMGIKEFPLELDDELLNATVSRQFISDVYGGNPQETFPMVSQENLARHGYDDFMFLNLDYNPRAPQRAGYPGLFFKCSDRDSNREWEKVQRVFVRISGGMWLYLGQYKFHPAAGLTPDEWKTQSHKVMSKWSSKVCTTTWGLKTRTRVALRRIKRREPTTEEIEHELTKKLSVTPEEVVEAYNAGDERIGVWAMECIGYDEAFQRSIINQFGSWGPVPKTKAKAKGKKAKV